MAARESGKERVLDKLGQDDSYQRGRSPLDLLREIDATPGERSSDQSSQKGIAVPPFSDLSANCDQSHLCEGIADELIERLKRLEGLRVASRSSSFQFRDSGLDAREIGSRLHVDSVLDGRVRKSDERLRVSAKLVDVRNGDDLWSKTFDREMVDVFEIHEEIVISIVKVLKLTLTPLERETLKETGTRVVGAYDYYLRGRQLFYGYTKRSMELALEMYSRAIVLDESHAPAWAGLADCCSFLYANIERDPKQLDRALEAGKRALTEDSRLAEAHVARAVALSYTDRAAEAQREFCTALHLDPRSFEATYFYARHCFTQDRMESAIRLYERAAMLRPDDYQALLLMAQNHQDLGHVPDAQNARRRGLRRVEERLEHSPDDSRALYMGANALVALGEIERGLEWASQARRLEPDEPMVMYNLACIYSMAGEADAAISCLEKSLWHGAAYLEWSRRDCNLDPLRRDPRFVKLLAEVAAPHALPDRLGPP